MFNGTQMVLESATLSRARFNAAEKAELCSRPENYGRNPDPSGEQKFVAGFLSSLL